VTQVRIAGRAAAPGIARGPWAELGRAPLPAARQIDASEIAGEAARLRNAAKAAARELRDLAASVREAGHSDEGAIFLAQAAIARDPDMIDPAVASIERDRVDAIGAIASAARETAARIAALDDELLRGRATDVLDVADRIARSLAGIADAPILAAPAIVIADDLPPSVTATLPRDRVLGIALEGSSPTAHAAILARAYGIPAVVSATGLIGAARAAGTIAELAIDGSTGEAIVDPDPEERARFGRLAAGAAAARERDLGEADQPPRTLDGVDVALLANIGSPDDAVDAVHLGARGVGLFRTEFLFLERARPPSEEEQEAAYRRVVESFAGQPVTIRLLDVGGDKQIPYLDQPREDNPFLGVRALRLAERRPDLFITQLRACYRAAAADPVKVMAPMIADASDAATLRGLADEARASLDRDGLPSGEVALGVMLEIPSAILIGDSYLDQLAFASLGTNDLLQYALAVDRGNPALERYRDSLHPALLRLIREAVESSSRAGIDLSVCGEMAGDPVAALALVGLGIRQLSMSAGSLAAVRRAIRNATASVLEAAATAALRDPSAQDVRERFSALLVSPGAAEGMAPAANARR
jgi:phosphoenolpyruvate-protein phosphotransferase